MWDVGFDCHVHVALFIFMGFLIMGFERIPLDLTLFSLFVMQTRLFIFMIYIFIIVIFIIQFLRSFLFYSDPRINDAQNDVGQQRT